MGVLTLGSLCENESEFLLPSMEVNKLFRVDLKKSNKAEVIGKFFDYKKKCAWKIIKVIAWNGKKYFFSRNSCELWEVDLEQQIFRHYLYSMCQVNIISNVEMYEGKVWIFENLSEKPVLCLNLNNMKCESIDWKSNIALGQYPIIKSVRKNKCIYFATRRENMIKLIVFNCENKNFMYKDLKNLEFINCIEVDEQNIWILGRSKEGETILEKYVLQEDRIESIIKLYLIEQLPKKILLLYHRMIKYDTKLFLIPALAEKIVVYDILSKQEKVLDYPEKFFFKKKKEDAIFFEIQQVQEKLYLFSHLSEQILVVNLKTLEMEIINIICDELEYEKGLLELLENEEKIMEKGNIGLSNFVQCLLNKKLKNKQIQVNDNGLKIYMQLSN